MCFSRDDGLLDSFEFSRTVQFLVFSIAHLLFCSFLNELVLGFCACLLYF